MTPVTMVIEGTVESASWYLLRAGSYCVSYINSFDPYWQDCSSSHFTDQETKVPRGEGTFSRPHRPRQPKGSGPLCRGHTASSVALSPGL